MRYSLWGGMFRSRRFLIAAILGAMNLPTASLSYSACVFQYNALVTEKDTTLSSEKRLRLLLCLAEEQHKIDMASEGSKETRQIVSYVIDATDPFSLTPVYKVELATQDEGSSPVTGHDKVLDSLRNVAGSAGNCSCTTNGGTPKIGGGKLPNAMEPEVVKIDFNEMLFDYEDQFDLRAAGGSIVDLSRHFGQLQSNYGGSALDLQSLTTGLYGDNLTAPPVDFTLGNVRLEGLTYTDLVSNNVKIGTLAAVAGCRCGSNGEPIEIGGISPYRFETDSRSYWGDVEFKLHDDLSVAGMTFKVQGFFSGESQ